MEGDLCFFQHDHTSSLSYDKQRLTRCITCDCLNVQEALWADVHGHRTSAHTMVDELAHPLRRPSSGPGRAEGFHGAYGEALRPCFTLRLRTSQDETVASY